MKYKVGDKLVFDGFGTFQVCEVVTVLEKTGRYRIKYPSNREGTDCIELKNERELFLTINDCIDSQIEVKKIRIEQYNQEIQMLEARRITAGSEAK